MIAPSRLTSTICRISARWSEVNGASSITPALLTRMSAPPELALHALGSRDDRVAVGHVGLDRQRAVAELAGQRLDAVGAAGQQRDAVAVGGQRARRGLADARGRAGDDRDAAGAVVGTHDAFSLCPVSSYKRGTSLASLLRARRRASAATRDDVSVGGATAYSA